MKARPTTLKKPVPTEDDEQAVVVAWLQQHGLPHFRVPSETFTTSWAQKNKNKRLGVVPGVPDLFVLFPGRGLIAIEMKRIKGSTTSLAQLEWQRLLNEAEVPAYICKGAVEAIAILEAHLAQK